MKIHDYVRKGNIKEVSRLINQKGFDINCVDKKNSDQTPLMIAVSNRDVNIEMVRFLVENGADINAVGGKYKSTVIDLAIQAGSLDKIKFLLDAGVDINYQTSDGYDVLINAMHGRDIKQDENLIPILNLLIERGAEVDGVSSYGESALNVASYRGRFDAVELLLVAGAEYERLRWTHLMEAVAFESVEKVQPLLEQRIIKMLIAEAENLNDINNDMRILLTGVGEEELHEEIKHIQDKTAKFPRFGIRNPEIMKNEFWEAMIRSGIDAYFARSGNEKNIFADASIWCYKRFGRTTTMLPDGRIVEIAGEHEDSYDPDFHIYNDVVVFDGKGNFKIYGYPSDVFPPTDFHSATLVENEIYIIGSLGYQDARIPNQTPVYRLDCDTFQIQNVKTTGDNPGWISAHKAKYQQPSQIYISGGKVCTQEGYIENSVDYILDLSNFEWSRVNS